MTDRFLKFILNCLSFNGNYGVEWINRKDQIFRVHLPYNKGNVSSTNIAMEWSKYKNHFNCNKYSKCKERFRNAINRKITKRQLTTIKKTKDYWVLKIGIKNLIN